MTSDRPAYFLGIDLGSTTSKAVIADEHDAIIGRGITNTRANYSIAAEIARQEAIYNARFELLKNKLKDRMEEHSWLGDYLPTVERVFQFLQFKKRADILHAQMVDTAEAYFEQPQRGEMTEDIRALCGQVVTAVRDDYFNETLSGKNFFFRDIFSEYYGKVVSEKKKAHFEPLMLVFDKSINPVENQIIQYDFKQLLNQAIDMVAYKFPQAVREPMEEESGLYRQVSETLQEHIDHIAETEIGIVNMMGTGYGRALLPFPENCIRSEILCHAFGAHAIFPNTRTVLDIGGQDTKAIQVDPHGLVSNFHMNDRCAAGCGRYLGYIADELSIPISQLGPTALEAKREVNICSTCTVFAGAELRELLHAGEEQEDILAGLHRAIVMRALSLLARSGGVRSEFTFTGGVARNDAVRVHLAQLVHQNYGEDIVINTHSDSIFMGAYGAALFARKEHQRKQT